MSQYDTVVAVLISGVGGLINGFDPAVMSPAGKLIQDEFHVTDQILIGFTTSIMLFGALIGSFLAGHMATRLGRRMTAIIANMVCLFGGLTPAFSVSLIMFLILRFVLGFGVGVIGVICPLYVNEVVPENKRGTYGVVFQITTTLGILLSYVVGYILVSVQGLDNHLTLQWRIMLSSFGTVLPLILMGIILVGMKETSGSRSAENTPLQNKESSEESSKGGWFGLFIKERFFSQTLTGIFLAVTLQLTGVNAIMYFGTSILASALPNSNPTLLNIGIGAWNFLATFIALGLVGRLKRKTLMTFATLLIAVSLILVGLCFQLIDAENESARGIGVGLGLFLFLMGFEAGPGCLFWVLANEIFDKNVMAEGASLCNVLQWAFNLAVSTLFPLMYSSPLKESGTFFIFGGFGFVCTLYFFFFLKEKSDAQRV